MRLLGWRASTGSGDCLQGWREAETARVFSELGQLGQPRVILFGEKWAGNRKGMQKCGASGLHSRGAAS
ncbi:hypothetical protein ACRRTK_011900 [Alexandromys fortis]